MDTKTNYKKAPVDCKPMKDFIIKESIEPEGAKKFLDHYKNWLETPSRVKGITKKPDIKEYGLIWDCYGGNLFNVDLELLQFLTNIWINYYPGGTKYVLLHELPWILRAIYRLARSWMPEHLREQICFASKGDIGSFVGSQSLPDYLNGQCKTNYKKAPVDCKSMKDFIIKESIEPEGAKKFL
uniref:CRAL-TRIO domain-containing protein n=1 Tax=Tetranychus urticae TaxID=32264 RepID=T1KS15_TETUR